MIPQLFKGDADELKLDAAIAPLLNALELQRDLFFAGAFQAAPLGDLMSDTQRSPLSNAIVKGIFRLAFKEIFDAFVSVGTFEAYIVVFKKIFGNDVGITFTVPAPGKLGISIVASGVELTNFITRYIEDNFYIFDNMITVDGDDIVFQTIKGFTSQYELEQMLFEMVPAGMFTNINLTLA